MKSRVVRIILSFVLSALLMSSMGFAQSTDRSELDEFLKETANQGPEPAAGTKITIRELAAVQGSSCRSG